MQWTKKTGLDSGKSRLQLSLEVQDQQKVSLCHRRECDEDLFGGGTRLALRSIAGAFRLYASNLHVSPDQASTVLIIDHNRALFDRFHNVFVPFFDKLNSSLSIGGCGFDVELDEVSFRSVERGHGIVWLKYLAVVRRGSSLVWLERLPYRITTAGEGGGGPISVAELYGSLLLESDEPVLCKGSVCHTDGAKAYRWLESPLNDGTLIENSLNLDGGL